MMWVMSVIEVLMGGDLLWMDAVGGCGVERKKEGGKPKYLKGAAVSVTSQNQ